jgi:release factor glutamine methyltransferase
MCTGSGCIAISLAKYIKGAEVDAVDISSPALTVAKKNAKLNEVNIKFIKSDLFENVEDKYDMIVSNPPYIRKSDMEKLQKEVKQEPKKALEGGEDGLVFYDRILCDAKRYLKKNGVILFEIGYDQAKDVMELAKKYNYKKIKKIKDLSNNDRVIIVER